MANPQAIIEIIAKAVGFEETLNKVEKNTEQAAKKMKTLAQRVEQVNAAVGEGSPLQRFAQLFTGGGLIAGLSMATTIIGDMAEKAAEMADEFREGEISLSEMPGEIAKSLPVLRDMFRVMESIAQIIDPIEKDLSEQVDQQREQLETLEDQLDKLNAVNALERARLEINREYSQTLEEVGRQQRLNVSEGMDPVAAKRIADEMARQAEAIRQIRMEEAERAAYAPVVQTIEALERELMLLQEGEEAVLRKALAEADATEQDIERAAAIHQKIEAIKAEIEAQKEAEREAKRRAMEEERRAKRVQALVWRIQDAAEREAKKFTPVVPGGFESVSGAFARIATAAGTSSDTPQMKTARYTEAMAQLLAKMEEQGRIDADILAEVRDLLQEQDPLARFN